MASLAEAPPAVPAPTARISHFPAQSLTERDLATLWQNQSFPPEVLVTTHGQPLRVIYRGRRVGGPGPDFRDAMIAAPSGLLQGDVELHVRSSDFHRHGHARDAAYNDVVLHLVFHHDEKEDTLLENGKRVAVAALARWVDDRAQEIRGWLERPVAWREPCFSAVTRLGAPGVAVTLDRLGDMRFRQKTAIFARRLRDEDTEQLLWEGLLEGLGFGGRREMFRLLAQRPPWDTLRSHLLTIPAPDRPARARLLLEGAFAELRNAPTDHSSRPGNRPPERLDGAAQLAARFTAPGLMGGLLRHLHGDPDDIRRSFSKLLTVPGAIGPSRAIELLTNAVLPFLSALGPEAQSRRAEALYHLLPLPARYGPVRHLHQALAGDVPINARRQQGMLYLLKQYCTQGGCGRCPLS